MSTEYARVPVEAPAPSSRARRRRGPAGALALCFGLLAAGLCTTAAPREARAEGELLRRHNWGYRNLLAARLNPLGLFNEFRFFYRHRLYQALPTILRESYVGVHGVATLSPAWGRIGAMVELQPLAILNLSATYEFWGNFGTFDTIQGFANVNSNFSDAAQDRSGAMGGAYPTYGTVLTLNGTLQARAGSIVIRSINRAFYTDLTMRDGRQLYYDIYLDVLAPARGWMFTSDNDIGMIPEGPGFGIGLRTTVTMPFYDPAVHGEAMGEALRNGPTLRTGPILTYNFYEANHARFNAPMVYVVANWWVLHRYRTGPGAMPQDPATDYINQAVPYLAVGFSFRGDLFHTGPVRR